MAKRPTERIVAWGREEAADKNHLERQKVEVEQAVRRHYRGLLAEARGTTKAALWLKMQAEIRRKCRRVEEEVAPRQGLYLQT